MALLRDFEIPGTGFVVDDAYHVIVNITTEKRLNDVLPPPDKSRPDELTHRDDEDETLWVYWKSGYIGKIAIEVYSSKVARDEGKLPIGALATSPTDVSIDSRLATPGKDFKVLFFIDPDGPDSIIVQAYKHLKTTEYYKNAVEA